MHVYTREEASTLSTGTCLECYVVTFWVRKPNMHWEQKKEQYFTQNKSAHEDVLKRWKEIYKEQIRVGSVKQPISIVFQ